MSGSSVTAISSSPPLLPHHPEPRGPNLHLHDDLCFPMAISLSFCLLILFPLPLSTDLSHGRQFMPVTYPDSSLHMQIHDCIHHSCRVRGKGSNVVVASPQGSDLWRLEALCMGQ
ncbi:hypothetical protein PAHAL_4G103400 [Panicum hallii]|uniref:Uncharacterized protein n=1 Tax=Panicum hallii TaxID=206008 RepID=A0A2T8JCH3_9POAL|nr:hypothetical protein PAHAL_4G103400 [Panicum hallii]